MAVVLVRVYLYMIVCAFAHNCSGAVKETVQVQRAAGIPLGACT
jgi:hypothetical protein